MPVRNGGAAWPVVTKTSDSSRGRDLWVLMVSKMTFNECGTALVAGTATESGAIIPK